MDNLLHLTANKLLIVILFSLICGQTYADTVPWNGNIAAEIANEGGNDGQTAEKPILIATADELAYLAQQANKDGKELNLTNGTNITNARNFEGLYFLLTADIDLGNQEWIAIGTQKSGSSAPPFNGFFDGDNHTITNLTSNTSTYDYVGVFGIIGSKAVIKNLHVVISDNGLSSNALEVCAGGIAGIVHGVVENCDVTGGKITANGQNYQGSRAGGITGANEYGGKITNCFATADVCCKGTSVTLGGIVGDNTNGSSITNCYSTGKVISETTDDNDFTGGIAGRNSNSTISNCYYAGKKVVGYKYAGGIAGYNLDYGSVNNCYTTTGIIIIISSKKVSTTFSTSNKYAGGIVGYNNSGTSIIQCYSLADVKAEAGDGSYAGGITGRNYDATINNCYAIGNIESDSYAGGITAMNYMSYTTSTVSYCYAAGKVTAKSYSGGIVGLNYPKAIISHCLALNIDGLGDEGTTKRRIAYNQSDATESNYASPLIEGEWTDKTHDSSNGEDLTSTNFNNSPGNALEDWDANIWDNLNNEFLPVFKGLGSVGAIQPNIPKSTYLQYTIQYNQPANGSISVKYTDAGGQEQDIPSGSNISGSMNLVITATPLDPTTHELENLTVNGQPFDSGNTHPVDGDVEIIASFKELPKPDPTPDPTPTPTPDPDPYPTVYHTVTLPAVEGATTDPIAGDYEVEAWSSFRFYLTIDKGYDKSVPVVTTDRYETIKPRSSDGAYIIKYIRQPIQIYIDGIVKNPDPVSNEVIQENKTNVWTTGGKIHIRSTIQTQSYIYSPVGKLIKAFRTNGDEQIISLPSAIYILRIGNEQFKVRL